MFESDLTLQFYHHLIITLNREHNTQEIINLKINDILQTDYIKTVNNTHYALISEMLYNVLNQNLQVFITVSHK